MEPQKHLATLGMPVRDVVTGYTGIITSICFDLYGCVQALVSSSYERESKSEFDNRWFDVARLCITEHKSVMQQPDFEKGYAAIGHKGGSDKPIPG